MQRRGEDKISAFTQTERITMVEMSTQTMFEISTQTEEEDIPAKFMSTASKDRQENIMEHSQMR